MSKRETINPGWEVYQYLTYEDITFKEGCKVTAAVRREYSGNSFPASTGVVVKELPSRNALIAMDAIAILEE